MTKSAFSAKYDYFRELLLAARKSAGLTQIDLGKQLSRPQSFVSKFERGERRLDVVEFLEIASVLGVDRNEFLLKLERPRLPGRRARR